MTGALAQVAVSASATTTPPAPIREVDPNSVTPGLLGFLVVFALALVCYLLFRNLTSRLRRMRFREEQRLASEADGGPSGPAGSSTPRR